MAAITQLTTAEDLLAMRDDGFRYELVRGELRKMTPAGHEHGRIAAVCTGSLVLHVMENGLGAVYAAETGFKIGSNPDHVRAPDVAFISKKRLEEVGDVEGYWPGAPDLVVEVISPSDVYTEVEEKVLDWLQAGSRVVIIVNPRKNIVTVYKSLSDIIVLTENDTIDGGDVVPGWTMPVAKLFA